MPVHCVLSTVLNKAELRLAGLVSSPFAAGLAALDYDERDLGVTIVEMGAGTTSLAVFSHGKLLHTAQLRIGGHHITRDIASALNVHRYSRMAQDHAWCRPVCLGS